MDSTADNNEEFRIAVRSRDFARSRWCLLQRGRCRSTFDRWPRSPLTSPIHHDDGGRLTARYLLTTPSKLFKRFGSHGEWHLRFHPTGPTSPVEGICTPSINGVVLHMHSSSTSVGSLGASSYSPPVSTARFSGDWPAGFVYKRLFYRVSNLCRC